MELTQLKARRLVNAQIVVEKLARSDVAKWVAQLAEHETKLELAKKAISTSVATQVFADIHMRHIQGLVERCSEASEKLAAARARLESEIVRTKKLRDRLKAAEVMAGREAENKAALEHLDWSLQRP